MRNRKTGRVVDYILNLIMYLPLITGTYFIMIAPRIAKYNMCREFYERGK